MPRTARASVGGLCYHVINRGNARAAVFHKPDDYRAFYQLLREAAARTRKLGSDLESCMADWWKRNDMPQMRGVLGRLQAR